MKSNHQELAALAEELSEGWLSNTTKGVPSYAEFAERLYILQMACTNILGLCAFNYELNPENEMTASKYIDELAILLREDVERYRVDKKQGKMMFTKVPDGTEPSFDA